MELSARKCKPCEKGKPPMDEKEVRIILGKVDGWEWRENKIRKRFKFKDFSRSMKFVNRVADLAEEEGHHPKIFVSWNRVTLTLTTHAIGGLSENDFILAAKIDKFMAA